MNANELAKENSVICPAPFSSVYIKQDEQHGEASYSCCCNLVPLKSKQELIAIQENIRNNRASDACARCYKHEQNNGFSERMRYLSILTPEAFELFVNEYKINSKEVYIKLSTKCPLSCRSCSPTESSTYALITKTGGNVHPNAKQCITEQPVSEKIKQELKNIHSESEYPVLHMTGGEVLAHRGAIDLIDWVIDNNYAQKFELRFTTSLGIGVNQELLDRLSKFKKIHFGYSIDSVGENYHYVRWPIQFSKLEKNLNAINQCQHTHPDFTSIIVPVWSINNIMYLEDYCDYFKDTQSKITPIQLIDPSYLTVTILPEPYRSEVADYIQQCLSHEIFLNPKHDVFKQLLQGLVDKLRNTNGDTHQFEQDYLYNTARFDTLTKTSMKEHNSKFHKMLLSEHIEKLEHFYDTLR